MRKILILGGTILLLLCVCGCAQVPAAVANKELCVVIDAGHGGIDPGVVGITGSVESELNLALAKELKAYFEDSGVKVVMTREDENGLYTEEDINKKQTDMKNRGRVIAHSDADAMISIHMNAISDRRCRGAQAFYQRGADPGLARSVQTSIVQRLQPDNHRLAHAGDYYVLKAGTAPSVIVECGFLSNTEDEAQLGEEEYRRKMAWCIYMGVMEFLQSYKIVA